MALTPFLFGVTMRKEYMLKKYYSKYFLYVEYNVYGDKPYHRKRGYFFQKKGKLYFQFSGKSFRMSNSKVYEPTCKKIDLETKTWISINKDRNGRRVCMWHTYINAANEVKKMMMEDAVHKMLRG